MKSVTHFSVLLIIAVQLFTAGKCLVEPRQDAAVFSEADLASLRTLMDQENIDAYIVPSGDAHYVNWVIIIKINTQSRPLRCANHLFII